jgi:hypothetical protein
MASAQFSTQIDHAFWQSGPGAAQARPAAGGVDSGADHRHAARRHA